MQSLVLASSNQGKLEELWPLLAESGFALVNQSELGVADAVEDGLTFVENALIKARHACRHTGLPSLAEDSGLIVDALGGAPGLASARYAGVHGDCQRNIDKLLAALEGLPAAQRRAQFHCTVVLLRHADDPRPLIAEGDWEGLILPSASGVGGFGYDPVFFDPQSGSSAAQLDPATKNRVSHRGKALERLRQLLLPAGC